MYVELRVGVQESRKTCFFWLALILAPWHFTVTSDFHGAKKLILYEVCRCSLGISVEKFEENVMI